MKCHITYMVSEDGECVETGFWMPGGWEHAIRHGEEAFVQEVLEEARGGCFNLTLRDALKAAKELGIVHEVSTSDHFLAAYSVSPQCDRDYLERGKERYYSLHVESTKGSIARVAKLLKGELIQ